MRRKRLSVLLLLCVSIGVLGVLLSDRTLDEPPIALSPAATTATPSKAEPPFRQPAFQDADAQITVAATPSGTLPVDSPTILLSDIPITPSPLNGDVRNLPDVPPSPDTKPEFDFEPSASKPAAAASAGNSAQPSAPAMVLGTMPSPSISFNAMDFNTNGAGHPPDPNGDVGANYYLEAVNTSIGIFNKQTGANVKTFTYNSFWSGAGTGTACDTSNQGDPIALYDMLGQRWIFMDFAWTNIQNGPYYFCFGVSQTSDPVAGGWWRYAIRADDANHPYLPDYPKGGVWPDGLYFSANMFDCTNSTCSAASYQEARAYAFNRVKMESGAALTANDLQAKDTNSSNFTMLPSNL